MTVITPGRNEPGWKTRVTCVGGEWEKGCGAVLEIEKSDLFVVRSHDICGPRAEPTFRCPCCKVSTGVKGEFSDLPSREAFFAAQPKES